MRLTMTERQKATAVMASRYQRARKKDKGKILDEFVELTGYRRSYASFVLSSHGRRRRIGTHRVLVADVRQQGRRGRPKVYGQAVLKVLVRIWYVMDCICGKRLASVMAEVLRKLEQFREILIAEEVRRKLCGLSAATIDRLLGPERKKYALKGRNRTKPGTLLKHQIPIRTFSDWDEKRPGFVEIDLVGHDGGESRGEYIQTLNVTDVCTGWTEIQAVRNKAQRWVFEALQDIRGRMPFALLGIDSDNGGEFINDQLLRYCQTEKITFTRTRSYRKNDNCFVEQKNYSIVRRAVGYARYDTEAELRILNELYPYVNRYSNFFQPVMKLIEKTRIGSKVIKKYDTPMTPYQRALVSPFVNEADKRALKKLYRTLNPASLKRQITGMQQQLLRAASSKNAGRKHDAA
jgi:hypothetical protein